MLVESTVFKHIFEFIYTGSASAFQDVNVDVLLEVLAVCDFMLYDHCKEVVVTQVSSAHTCAML